MTNIFYDLIEPNLDRIPIIRAEHQMNLHGRKFNVAQTLSTNVYTEFDRKLSEHLAVVDGSGFPIFTLTIEFADVADPGRPRQLTCEYLNSLPQALKAIAERASAQADPNVVQIYRGTDMSALPTSIAYTRQIGSDNVQRLEEALVISRHLGDAAFLEVTGDFDTITLTPPGGLAPVVINLQEGMVETPSSRGAKHRPFEWPIANFTANVAMSLCAQGYLASVGHAIVARKEKAILAFRDAAEQAIHAFDRALHGRALKGHWRSDAGELLARLKAGLGDSLTGVSADARGLALEWCAALDDVPSRAEPMAPLPPAIPPAIRPAAVRPEAARHATG